MLIDLMNINNINQYQFNRSTWLLLMDLHPRLRKLPRGKAIACYAWLQLQGTTSLSSCRPCTSTTTGWEIPDQHGGFNTYVLYRRNHRTIDVGFYCKPMWLIAGTVSPSLGLVNLSLEKTCDCLFQYRKHPCQNGIWRLWRHPKKFFGAGTSFVNCYRKFPRFSKGTTSWHPNTFVCLCAHSISLHNFQ